MLTADDLEPALAGGLLLSAGGSGRRRAARGLALGRMALDYGGVELASLDELDPAAPVITATAVGAPGFATPMIAPRDCVDAARRLMAAMSAAPAGVICGHVPGFNAWLVAAALGLPYVDAASNGRGHPTVKMGGMGLASRPELAIVQVACSSGGAGGRPLTVLAEGDIARTSNLMRQAAIANGGLIYAARGPLAAGFIRDNGAAGAVSFQLDLGRAMLDARGPDRAPAAAAFLGGSVLAGEVTANTVAYSGGFDVGRMTVRTDRGDLVLGIYNEYMAADLDGERIASFPDMIGTLDPASGEAVAISELAPGSSVAVVVADRSGLPVGKGALDPAVFPEVEEATGLDLRSYL
jgi:DUF917 family protein